ncbi:MAG: carbamoyltransferase HypF [Anaerolinea sp.]|nr:carbamoyltransferase HypF [Anaerolinea sp.]
MNNKSAGLKISVTGIVQGVGFRPFVFTLATNHHLSGTVWNTSKGVEIEVFGSTPDIDLFYKELREQPPALARIDKITADSIPFKQINNFTINSSQVEQGQFLPISPDMSICPDCRRELFDPANRRYRYPFINCTNCGPRFSIIKDTPYDRTMTTMARFPLCPACKAEYDNPLDRRFHAQPVACHECGPRISFETKNEGIFCDERALRIAKEYIKQGKIIALKGLGGYHLVCNAENSHAVQQLRERKKRSDRPFALMAFDKSVIRKYCQINETEASELESPQHPIVLLRKNDDCSLPVNIAPSQNHLGFMLPYTPLHLLLLEPEKGFPEVLVMTSGNMSDEPIAYEDDDARQRLSLVADGFLLHNRPIHMRVDDSVIRVFENQPYFIRRSRGYAPNPILINFEMAEILACGAELKNTFCLSRSNYAFLSHHIGDLENYETLDSFERSIDHYQRLFRINPRLIASDIHPDYLSTKYAIARSTQESIPLLHVQHHHAHLAACLIDNNYYLKESVIGLIFDGTGYGTDGNIWGGEVLIGSCFSYQRRFHLAETPLPGGDTSIRNPARIALAQLFASSIDWSADLPPVQTFSQQEQSVIRSQIVNRINTPLTTSMGRLFDAVASLIGVRQIATYEGQAAIELENLYDKFEVGFYQLPIESGIIHTAELFNQIIYDLRAGVARSVISSRFHNGLSEMCLAVCKVIKTETGIETVALSGGVWQNTTLLQKTLQSLKENGFRVLIHHQIPANDGGISLGQLMVAATTFDQDLR